MAEVLLKLGECVVSETVNKLADLLIQEAVSLSTVKDDVERLKDELTRMFSFLRDADTKQKKNHLVRTWIQQVTAVAHDIEDMFEIFISEVKFSNFFTKPRYLHNLRKEITLIQTRIDDIFKAQKQYDIQPYSVEQTRSFAADRMQDARRTFPDLDAEEDDFVINLEDSMKALKTQLTREEDELSTISIVGMGGLGKTTCAKKVYNQSEVRKRFDCRAWVFVSQQYLPRDILSDILLEVGWAKTIEETKNARETLRQLEVHDMIAHLNQLLKEKRYLVVLDDIWEIHAWNSVRKAFPKGKKGSKVVFTTRNERVTESLGLFCVQIRPPLLNDEDSFKLLCKKAFRKGEDGNHSCPPKLVELGRKMAKECKGLPLAIVVLGGLLKMKKSEDEWLKVENDLKSQLNKVELKERGVEEILALSYYDLPYDLKPFFLYLGNFPEDKEIPKRKLIRLWLAEGVMRMPASGKEATPIEDLPEKFLEELIDRNMVQVGKTDHTGVRVKTCRLHDLMRDLSMSKAREEKFCGVMQLQPQMNPMIASSSSTSARRIALYFESHHDHNAVWVSQLHPHLRSLLCFDISALSLLPLSKKQFRLLRVLEIGFSSSKTKCKMPRTIGDLIHLRYLGLRAAGISELPSTIGNLQNLLTLDVRDNDGVILPAELSKLRRLIHLIMPLNANASHVRIDKLTNIETLKFVEAANLIRNDAKRKLVHVRNLGIEFKSSKEAEVILKSPIVQSGRLQSLTMSMPGTDSFSSLQPLTDCTHLCKLDVTGKIPSDLQYLPPNLTKLVLERSELNQDPMVVLETLKELKFLRMGALSYKGVKLVCSANGFPKLETLQLNGLFKLEEWKMESPAMPSLKRLDIEDIPQLRMLPEEIQYVITLQELNVSMHQSFGDRLRGEDSYKVPNGASVTIVSVEPKRRRK